MSQLAPVGGPASGRCRGKQLVDEDACQPLFVPLGGPAPVTDEQPVYLGARERVNDVVGVALAQLRPQRAAAVMQLLGSANWWLPCWIGRAIPSLATAPDPGSAAGAIKVPDNRDETARA